MNEIEKLKETILNEAPRFSEKDKFAFSCHEGLGCFTGCCADVNIFLTPYDVLRMKNGLGLTSDEFLAKYTFVPFSKEQFMPVVVLKMDEEKDKRCPFVTDSGCSIYEDRPWSCRMYPLGFASPKEGAPASESEFYFVMEEGDCQGFVDGKEMTVGDWLVEQGIIEYNEMGEFFKELALHDFFQEGEALPPEKMEMFYTACYNLDRFRRFIFESSFLGHFKIDPETVEAIEKDDVELMKFAFKWLRFSLFNEPLIEVRKEVLERKRVAMATADGI
jgi:Fe-S-cluster containining protein